MVWLWLVISIILLIIEFATAQMVCIWFFAGALAVTLITAIFPTIHLFWQIAIFIVVSATLLILTRTIAKRMVKNDKVNQATNVQLNVGKEAIVIEEINNFTETGAIKINGLVWTARSIDDSVIPAGEVVIFSEVRGNKALVAKKSIIEENSSIKEKSNNKGDNT